MCYNCYEEHGSPTIVNEGTEKAAKLIAAVYEYSCVGGNCHIVLDDFNIKDRHIDWCLETALSKNVHEADVKQLALERECLEAMKALTISERASALAIHEGWLEI
jgi:hypothetical protein